MPTPSRSFRPAVERLEDRTTPSLPSPAAPAAAAILRPAEAARAVRLPAPPPFVGSPQNYTAKTAKFRLDAHGVLQAYVPWAGWYYNPASIAQYTLALYKAYYEGNHGVRSLLRANAHWLATAMVRQTDAHGRAIYFYPYPWAHPAFGLPAGWRSALAGGQALAALTAAGRALGDPGLERQAEKLLPAFDLRVSAGGYRIPLGRHAVWYEEAASPAVAVTPRILNGHMQALAALDWYARLTGSARVARLVQEGVNGLALALPLYDQPPLSLYDLKLRNEWPSYHRAHVQLLSYWYHRTGVREFLRYANAWAARGA
jgi:heparosan-N-sulfate-glucuronate 5-epimerase